MKIRTRCICPPIPTRNFDWEAWDDDTYDGAPDSSTRNQLGHGATKLEAIADLLRIRSESQGEEVGISPIPKGVSILEPVASPAPPEKETNKP